MTGSQSVENSTSSACIIRKQHRPLGHDELYHHLHLNVVRWIGQGPVDDSYQEGFLCYNPLNLSRERKHAIVPVRTNVFYADNEANVFNESIKVALLK